MFKNIEKSQVLKLANEINYQEGSVISKSIVQNKFVTVTLFAFDKGEGLSMHKSKGDAFVTVLDGTVKVTIDDKAYMLTIGDSIIMPANIMHGLEAVEKFKMQLTIVFPTE
ncbi:cupin domain-containing protein [Acholeplasma hippikon]|uniref:Mannose-1-phosphate guanyltransferase n=1 Tax=Acholeplasma hippikon TaxID=264636 RepID=A0A449BIE3_9MOLU|nr:cupin domain-containing protein [Acholeplasma hippikon]VEU82226.1 mannose-1-phosphate guanyltransferase [Acholeplasma hippikon]